MKIYNVARMFGLTTISLLLAACPLKDDSSAGLPAISIANLGDAAVVETPDISIRLYGTAQSDDTVTSVSWQNARGGNGVANGTENWATGRISLQTGRNTITLTATDTVGNENTKSIVIERKKPGSNSAPTIAGVAADTASINIGYEFQPDASDPDNDTLTFSIQNKPSWAAFNNVTGRLHGVPANSNIGPHNNIRISVSDGTTSTPLPAFTINVVGFANGSATVSWNPPTLRTDNSPLADLAGYQIEYGLLSGNFGNVITINNPGTAAFVVENLSRGSWKFVVRAFDSSGQLSSRSVEGRKTIQ